MMPTGEPMKLTLDDIESEPSSLHGPLNQNTIVVTQSSLNPHSGSNKTSFRRRYSSSLSSKTNHKVVLEIPMQYGFASSRSDVSRKSEGLRFQQTSRLSLNSSFPILPTPVIHQKNVHAQDYPSRLLNNMTCHVAASSAIRGRTGYSTGSIQVHYRHRHRSEQRLQETFTSQTPEMHRWASTITAGVGVQQCESSNGESGAPVDLKPSNALPFPILHLGCSTSVAQPLSSMSTSFSTNVQIPKLSKVVLPLTVSNQQRIKFQSGRSVNAFRSLDVCSQCTTIFDYSTRSSQLNLSTINATCSLSPSSKTKDADFSIVRENSHRILQQWSLLVGINKQKDSLKPVVGVSLTLKLPKLVRSLWKVTKNELSNTVLDFAMQWKGGPSWQMNGWWIQKQIAYSNKTNRSSQRPIRQIGVGVNFNHGSRRLSSALKQPLWVSPLGVLSWIFTWTEGDFSLRIPILLSGIAVDSIWYHQGFQIFYLSFLSSIIQDVVGQFTSPVVPADMGSELVNENNSLTLQQNARNDAILQQKLMERPARIRTALEEERNGLVIRKAIFYIDYQNPDISGLGSGGDLSQTFPTSTDADSLDVTVPLQFWLSPNESKLLLYGKRSSMLGFYDLSAHCKTKLNGEIASSAVALSLASRTVNAHASEKPSLWERFLSFFLSESIEPQSNCASEGTNSAPSNKLWIRYDFCGKMYEITVSDAEEIEIPNAKGKLIA